jgi:hypothetical protein
VLNLKHISEGRSRKAAVPRLVTYQFRRQRTFLSQP